MQTLKAWLRPNHLTEAPNDYIAVPLGAGSLTKEDIIKDLKTEGMEIKEETALDIITRFNRKVSERVVEGYSVNTGLVQMRPKIKGVFLDKTFDPAKHLVYVNILQGTDLRKAIAETKVEILGQQSEPMAIFGITDKATGKVDGSLTKGKNAEVKGTYIKVAGEHTDNGIYFTNIDSKVKTKVSTEDIVINEPSRLMILVPDSLTTGTYELGITTQYSNGSNLLKQPRTVVLDNNISIG